MSYPQEPACWSWQVPPLRDTETEISRALDVQAILGYRRYYTGRGWVDGWWKDTERARRLTGNPGWELIEEAVP